MLDVARREHDFVTGFDPDGAERAANIARADDADLHRIGRGQRKRQGDGSNGNTGNDKKSTTMCIHGNSSLGRIIPFLVVTSSPVKGTVILITRPWCS